MEKETISSADSGFLLVRTRSAGRSYPLDGTNVEIFLRDETGAEQLYLYLLTDAGGTAPRVRMPVSATAKAGISATPACVRVHRKGYYSMEARDVPIFEGITSLQEFEMIPLPESASAAPPDGRILTVSDIRESPTAPSPALFTETVR